MRVLVWQWGRKGAGPRYASQLAAGLASVAGNSAVLSLSTTAEIMEGTAPPDCALPFPTYSSGLSLLARLPRLPFELPWLIRRLRALAPDVAICAMPAALDLLMATALRWLGVPFYVVIHDADAHPGDGVPFQMVLQHALIRCASGVVTLTAHVGARVRALGLVGARPLLLTSHPPFAFGPPPPPPLAHGGRLRLLSFGRLLPYKGLDLLAAALTALDPAVPVDVRVVGKGPDSPALAALARLPHVRVENRWVPEAEVGDLLAWADALVLSHTEASQSGVAAAAIASRRYVVSTNVGGLVEQLHDETLARLCPPTAEGLATAITDLAANPPPTVTGPSTEQVWHDVAARLVSDIAAARGAAGAG